MLGVLSRNDCDVTNRSRDYPQAVAEEVLFAMCGRDSPDDDAHIASLFDVIPNHSAVMAIGKNVHLSTQSNNQTHAGLTSYGAPLLDPTTGL